MKIEAYDTTLRDGSQAEDISFSAEDKVRIAHKLDELGFHYVEGGWPGSNPKDLDTFAMLKKNKLKKAKLAAFGATCRAGTPPSRDASIQMLLRAETPVVTIFGKTWDFHVTEALRIELATNLDLIHKSIKYLKSHVDQVIYDAEHFFDGYIANPEYAMRTLEAAVSGGADILVLCDTNGGGMPHNVATAVETVGAKFKTRLGIHCHNDGELAVANSLAAVRAGVTHVQGTINGYGERCGNASLVSIIPNLMLKMDYGCIPQGGLKKLRELSRFVEETANRKHDSHRPFTGESAFAHKGGVHVSAVERNPETYEHINPETVGNHRRILISDLSGRANVLAKARELGVRVDDTHPVVAEILGELKQRENEGFLYEGAEASFEILLKKKLGKHKRFFELKGFRVIDEKRSENEDPIAEATIMVQVGDEVEHTAAIGNGPVNALDSALRKALEKFYPSIRDVHLLDFKVRVTGGDGTGSRVRVVIESSDGKDSWSTVGVSENIIQASYMALVDSIDYKLLREEKG